VANSGFRYFELSFQSPLHPSIALHCALSVLCRYFALTKTHLPFKLQSQEALLIEARGDWDSLRARIHGAVTLADSPFQMNSCASSASILPIARHPALLRHGDVRCTQPQGWVSCFHGVYSLAVTETVAVAVLSSTD